jgi:hypothetical protein
LPQNVPLAGASDSGPREGDDMSNSVRKHAATICAVFMTALVVGGLTPAVAGKGPDAGTVDGIHATKYTKKKAKRKNKLVATNTAGLLPNNIIKKAPNANKLDGIDSSELAAISHTHAASEITGGGEGSGLNADQLDGKSSGDFVEKAGTGIMLVQGDVSQWTLNVGTGGLAATPGVDQTQYTSASTTGNASMFIIPTLPLAANGKALRMVGVEFCYDASTNHVIDVISYHRVSNSSGAPSPSNQVLDTMERTDEACRYYALGDTDLFSDSTVSVSVQSAWTASGASLRLGRVTFMLEPTATNATPLS